MRKFSGTGAFKVRGATNAVFGLNDDQARLGVATHSSGNHASCLSYAAMRRGIPCNVVMPHTAPQAKKDTVRRYNGIITECEPSPHRVRRPLPRFRPKQVGISCTLQRSACDRGPRHLFQGVHGTNRWHGYGDRPIGGGGMVSGTCLTLSTLAPETQIIAAEPEQADDAYRSFKAGYILRMMRPKRLPMGYGAAERADMAFRIQSRQRHFHGNGRGNH